MSRGQQRVSSGGKMEAEKPKKQHKKRTSGLKAKKKKEKQAGGKVDRHNPRAHTFSGGKRSVQKRVQRSLDKQVKKDRQAKIDKNPDVPPPFIVVVQGPPGVGKTTLIRSLVRHFSHQRLVEMNGPVTLVSGRYRRLTIVECPQDMSSMLDLAKVADLVLLMIDGSYGFELETFEFINILQVHGFPRIIGVLTHLDGFKENKKLKKMKSSMKHRFWTELYEGAKLFHMSGLQYGRYHRVEVQNLARFISIQKTAILSWRQAHPYMLALRWEDQTDPEAAAGAPRQLDIYGYVCGGRMRQGALAHLPGAGDFTISAIKPLTDPCPPPLDVETERQSSKGADGKDVKKNKNLLRTLAERHRVVYAPGSDVGSITVDADAMYINLPEHSVGFTKREAEDDDAAGELPEAVRLVRELQDKDAAMERAERAAAAPLGLQLLKGTTVAPAPAVPERRPAPLGGVTVDLDGEQADDEGEEEEDDEEESEEEDDDEEGAEGADGKDAENSDDEHRRKVLERARERFEQTPRLETVIYGHERKAGAAAGTKRGKRKERQVPQGATDHATLPLFDADELDQDGDAGEARGRITGATADPLGNLGDLDALDTTRMPVLPGGESIPDWDDEAKEALKAKKFITGGWSSAEEDEDLAAEDKKEDPGKPQAPRKGEEGGDTVSKAKQHAAVGLDAAQAMEGSAPIATFVRVRLEDVPAAVVAEMRSNRPLILGCLLGGEARMGMVQLRVKRHRWHPKLLKSGDPLLMSVGWRRFQTTPTFSLEDRGEKRMRYLKYSLEHAHCCMTFFGPSVPPNTGVLAFRSWGRVTHFRVGATGGVLESAPNFDIVKKLKLVGEPYKIFKNTAFVRNMFNSDLEVSKYMHTKIQTQSGIRGEIKKAEGRRGDFRATFEDRILMSDLVVCKCWINTPPKQFYHPVIDVAQWRPAKTIGELRAEKGVPVPQNADSAYGKQQVRAARKFNPLKIPKSLETTLPFKSRQKMLTKESNDPLRKAKAVVMDERERRVNQLMERLAHVRKERQRIKRESGQKKLAAKEKREAFIQSKRDAHQQEAKKKRYIKQGNQEQQRRKAMRLD